jgi:hypothetical protein
VEQVQSTNKHFAHSDAAPLEPERRHRHIPSVFVEGAIRCLCTNGQSGCEANRDGFPGNAYDYSPARKAATKILPVVGEIDDLRDATSTVKCSTSSAKKSSDRRETYAI